MIFASFIAALWVIHRGTLPHQSHHIKPNCRAGQDRVPILHIPTHPLHNSVVSGVIFAAQSVLYPAVGYSTSSHTKSTYITAVPGFTAISGAKKLSDLSVKNGGTTPKLNASTFKLMIFGKNSNPMYVKNDDTLKVFSPDAYAKYGAEDSIKELAFFYAENGTNPNHWHANGYACTKI